MRTSKLKVCISEVALRASRTIRLHLGTEESKGFGYLQERSCEIHDTLIRYLPT
jgi:hypothetical protein